MSLNEASPWPDGNSSQVQVMILGTYHMDNPGLDEINVDADDVLSSKRQTELAELNESLVRWEPDRVAVERPHDRAEELNARYQEYKNGERSYEQEERFPSPHGERDEPATECRSEVVQIGFRVADALDHSFITAIDEHPDGSQYEEDPFDERTVNSTRKTATDPKDPSQIKQEGDERLSSCTIREYHRWLNSEDNLYVNHEGMFDRAIRATGERFGSPLALEYWYDRNIRMTHHIWRTMDAEDEKILLLVGSGHVRILRHLLTEAPMFCPVSPEPYL